MLIGGNRASCLAVAAHDAEARGRATPDAPGLALNGLTEYLSEGDLPLASLALEDREIVLLGGDRRAPDTHASDASIKFSWRIAPVRSNPMTDRLYFTDSDDANALIASDPMALLVGFVLDQQVTVQKAFMGPLVLRERLGALDPDTLVDADLDPVFRARPAIHRFPGAMAQRVHDLALHVRERYDGDGARVWTDAADSDALRANLAALPGFGEMKIKALGAVLAKRFGVEAAGDLVPWHLTLGDVDSPQALEDYQAAKRVHKAEWATARLGT